ncbi:MAG: hypothetical protein M3R36_04205 [Bacteroidota bacterium]|nr:hypothetical protein [Bacteroidota bacterium]
MKYLILFSFAAIVISSCSDKTDLAQFPITSGGVIQPPGEITYVQQSPTWNQFNQPAAVLVGREPLVYVADTKNNRVVQLDISGAEIGSIGVRNPIAIAQDYNFELLVIGDSALTFASDTISVLYRIKLVPVGGIISNATLLPLIGSDYPTPLTSRQRKFTGVGVFANNSYIVTRTGPNNTSTLDPDNAILKMTGIDSVTQVTSLGGFQTTGNGIYSIADLSAITTFNNELTDFIVTRNTTDFAFKIEWFLFDAVKETYNPKFQPGENVDILNFQLGTPVGVTVDQSKNVYVVDDTKDSLYKFTTTGMYRNESFGGTGSGEKQLRDPKGVSFFNRVLYIADTGNNRIVRYKLSTDIF